MCWVFIPHRPIDKKTKMYADSSFLHCEKQILGEKFRPFFHSCELPKNFLLQSEFGLNRNWWQEKVTVGLVEVLDFQASFKGTGGVQTESIAAKHTNENVLPLLGFCVHAARAVFE